MLPTTWRMSKTILQIYSLLLKISFYTSYSPLKLTVSSNKVFYWSSKTPHKVRTISVLFTPAWVMTCPLHTTLSVFLMQIKSLYCLFADFVLPSLSTPGFIYSFLYMCKFQCHEVSRFGVKDLTLFVAEGSGRSSPAPVSCSKHMSVENKWLHHSHDR